MCHFDRYTETLIFVINFILFYVSKIGMLLGKMGLTFEKL